MDSKLQQFLNRDNCYFIHYAGNGFFNGSSPAPKIACIVTFNQKNNCEYIFSLKNHTQVNSKKEAEKLALENFKLFLQKNSDICFIHWNMNADGFGFKAIQARAKELGVELPAISEENLFDLASYVAYVAEKRLTIKQILWFNSLLYGDKFLDGKTEAEYFENGKYIEICNSVKLKVNGFSEITNLLKENKLKTEPPYQLNDGLTREERRKQALIIAHKREQMLNDIIEHNKRVQEQNEEFILDRQAKFDFVDGIMDILRLFILFK